MELGAFSVVDGFPPGTGVARDRFEEVLALARAAEAAGLRSFWVAEHHFQRSGLCPSPPVLLAAAGARTRSIRLGSLVRVLPFHDPVVVAEEFALLDHLLHGRLEVGVGSGYIPFELDGFGVSPEEKRARFDDALAVLRSAWAGRSVRAARGAGRPVRIAFRPVQRPAPPVWVAVQRREALVALARRGLSVALIPYATVGGTKELAETIAEYRRALPRGSTARVAAAVHLYAGPRERAARAALQRYLDARLATGSRFFQAKVHANPEARTVEGLVRQGLVLLGRPARVLAGLDAYARAGVDELLGIFDFGGLPIADVLGSVRSLGRAWSRRPS